MLQAGSGDEALALLRAGARPDAIFMDLAMPGIDGWETIRRLRAERLADGAPVAVVSANAFDKGLDNDAGIAPADFIVKPVRLAELLDWLGDRLALTWIDAAPPHAGSNCIARASCNAAVAAAAKRVAPACAGRGRGARPPARHPERSLDRIEADEPACIAFAARLRTLAREFQFDAMSRLIDEGASA